MTKRRLAIVLVIPLLLAVILIGGLYGALHTNTGARWILSGLQGQLPGKLELSRPDGDLATGLLLKNISYRDPGFSATADEIGLAVSLDLLPLSIRIKSLRILSLQMQALPGEPGEAPRGDPSFPDKLSSLAPPLRVDLEDLTVDGFTFLDADGSPIVTVERLAAAVLLHEKLQVRTLVIEMDNNRYQLDGSMVLAEPFPIEANLNSKMSLVLLEDGRLTDFDIQSRFEGKLSERLDIALTSLEPAVTVTGTLHDLWSEPQWRLDIESPRLWWPLDSPQSTAGGIDSLRVHSEGWIEGYTLAASGDLQIPELGKVELYLKANGDSENLLISDLDLSGQELDLNAVGELRWREELKIKLLTTLNRIDPGAWISEWPAEHPVSGEFEFSLQNQNLQVSRLHLEVGDSLMTLDGSGNANLAQETLTSEITWQDVAWPLESKQPDIQSHLGRILLSGTFDDWNLAGEADIESAGLPPGTLRLEAMGDRKHASMNIVEGRILGGTIRGDAEYDWSEAGRWSASLEAEGIETQGLHSALPGAVNADLHVLGKLEPFRLNLEIRKLEGEIRGEQLVAGGRLQIQPGSLEFDNVHLSSAESRVTLHGSTSSPAGLEFAANIVDLGSFLVHSSGSIEADGSLSLHAANPSLRLDLEGQDLAWEEIRLPRISVHNSADPKPDAIAGLHLEAEYLQFAGQLLDSISLDLDVDKSSQAISLAARKAGLELSARLKGSLRQNGLTPGESEWTGQLDSLQLSEGGLVAVELLEPAAIEMSAQRAAITTACLGAGSDSKLCLTASWAQDGPFSTNLKLTRLPLNLIHSLLDTELELTQYAEGELHWESAANGPPNGRALVHLSPGHVRFAGETESLLETGQGLIGFQLDEGSLSAGNFDVPLPGMGEIDLDFKVANVSSGLDSEWDGRVRINLNDLDLLTYFLPMIDQAGGRFDADLILSGSPGNPSFNGQLSLVDGLVLHEASGLRLSDIQLSGKVIGNDETQMTGSFRAQEGTGRLQAVVDLSDIQSPRVELGLTGENLTLLDAADLKVVAEPDIHLEWQDGVIDIDGSLQIPEARVAPSVIPESPVLESPDLVIVAGEIAGSETAAESKSDIAVRGNFEVTLGDEVELDLSLAVAQVSGSVKFTWQDDLVPMANGSYQMVGQIQAFGQLLQITEGNIGFPGVPADNPHLNIRAERQIYGNSEVRRAGVFVTGTLNRPVMEPYTDPMTNRERAQTLLITGSDFNMETGVGAVDIGTYIAPRIFVSYGIGVFEDENVISIRYDLGRNWGIKATSGQRQTGLDISYTIER